MPSDPPHFRVIRVPFPLCTYAPEAATITVNADGVGIKPPRNLKGKAINLDPHAKPDTKPDTLKKSRGKELPQGDGHDFCRFLKRRLRGRKPKYGELTELAAVFCEEHPDCESEPASLLRKARDYPHLWKRA